MDKDEFLELLKERKFRVYFIGFLLFSIAILSVFDWAYQHVGQFIYQSLIVFIIGVVAWFAYKVEDTDVFL